MSTPATHRTGKLVVAQVAGGAWPTSDAGWSFGSPYELTVGKGANEGVCNLVGTVQLSRKVGRVTLPGRVDIALKNPYGVTDSGGPNIQGSWVRLLIEDPSGTVDFTEEDASIVKVSPFWWGKVRGSVLKPRDGVGMEEVYTVDSLARALQETAFKKWYETTGAATYCEIGELPGFNIQPQGDMSAADRTIAGLSVRVLDRSGQGSRWTARKAAEAVLAAVKDQQGGPTFVLGGEISNADVLSYTDTWCACDNALEMLARIITPRRGHAFRVTVVAHVPTVFVYATRGTAVTTDGVTFPASAHAAVIDLTDSYDYLDWALTEDADNVADELMAEGQPEWLAITLGYGASSTEQLKKGWSSTQETAWTAAATNAAKAEGQTGPVWRRFAIDDAWDGLAYSGGQGLSYLTRTVATSDLHGVGGETGEFQTGGTIPRAHSLRFTHNLPMWEGYNWDTQAVATADRSRELMHAQAYGVKASAWYTLASLLGQEDISLQVEDDCAAVILGGPEDGAAIKSLVSAGYDIVVTIGLKHPSRLRVSYKRDPGDMPTTMARPLTLPASRARRWTLLADTVVRLNGTTKVTRGATVRLVDELPMLRQVLAAAIPFYIDPARKMTWTTVGLDVTDYYAPGALLTSATIPFDPDVDGYAAVQPINASIVERSWNFSDPQQSTTWTTARLGGDGEATR